MNLVKTIIVIGIAISGCVLMGQTVQSTLLPQTAAQANPDAAVMPFIQAIQDSNTPAAADKAFAAGAAVDANSIGLNGTYMLKMLELGMPDRAYNQAKVIERAIPTDGLALGVIAYTQARQGQMADALAGIILAAQSQPKDPFIVITLAQLTAWFDVKDRTEIPGYVREALAELRPKFADQKTFKEAYDDARVAYKELEAAAQKQALENPDVALTPGPAMVPAPVEQIPLPQPEMIQPQGQPVMVPAPADPYAGQAPVTYGTPEYAQPADTQYPAGVAVDQAPAVENNYYATNNYYASGGTYTPTYGGDAYDSGYYPTYTAADVCYDSPAYMDYYPAFAPVFVFGDFRRHWCDVVILGRSHHRGVVMGCYRGRDIVMDHDRRAYVSNAPRIGIDRSGRVAVDHRNNIPVTSAREIGGRTTTPYGTNRNANLAGAATPFQGGRINNTFAAPTRNTTFTGPVTSAHPATGGNTPTFAGPTNNNQMGRQDGRFINPVAAHMASQTPAPSPTMQTARPTFNTAGAQPTARTNFTPTPTAERFTPTQQPTMQKFDRPDTTTFRPTQQTARPTMTDTPRANFNTTTAQPTPRTSFPQMPTAQERFTPAPQTTVQKFDRPDSSTARPTQQSVRPTATDTPRASFTPTPRTSFTPSPSAGSSQAFTPSPRTSVAAPSGKGGWGSGNQDQNDRFSGGGFSDGGSRGGYSDGGSRGGYSDGGSRGRGGR